MQHGHVNLIRVLSTLPDIQDKTLVEIGSIREDTGTCSTRQFARLVQKLNMKSLNLTSSLADTWDFKKSF